MSWVPSLNKDTTGSEHHASVNSDGIVQYGRPNALYNTDTCTFGDYFKTQMGYTVTNYIGGYMANYTPYYLSNTVGFYISNGVGMKTEFIFGSCGKYINGSEFNGIKSSVHSKTSELSVSDHKTEAGAQKSELVCNDTSIANRDSDTALESFSVKNVSNETIGMSNADVLENIQMMKSYEKLVAEETNVFGNVTTIGDEDDITAPMNSFF
jgi:hypothetical protein